MVYKQKRKIFRLLTQDITDHTFLLGQIAITQKGTFVSELHVLLQNTVWWISVVECDAKILESFNAYKYILLRPFATYLNLVYLKTKGSKATHVIYQDGM